MKNQNGSSTNTSYKVVLPFYGYAAVFFLLGTILLISVTDSFTGHHFHPHILAVTHIMALGWGTMMILGASYQLIPVLTEHALFSERLALLSFAFAAVGIPLLVSAFYTFNMGWPAITGGLLINMAILLYLINIGVTITKSKKENVHAVFVFTATTWLLLTTIAGLLLVINFSSNILPQDSLSYLSLHAHLGIGGWFLLLVIGVGSRLIPMFLISKYERPGLLWFIFTIVNLALVSLPVIQLSNMNPRWYAFSLALVISGIVAFAFYIYKAFTNRIRKKVENTLKISMASVGLMGLPLAIAISILCVINTKDESSKLYLLYGFSIFFGWLTAIITGMTFKTVPFIIWNKLYHHRIGLVKPPEPKELYSNQIFGWMGLSYFAGFLLFAAGLLLSHILLLRSAATMLAFAAFCYNWNVFKMILRK